MGKVCQKYDLWDIQIQKWILDLITLSHRRKKWEAALHQRTSKDR